jgi:hypothetical protein
MEYKYETLCPQLVADIYVYMSTFTCKNPNDVRVPGLFNLVCDKFGQQDFFQYCLTSYHGKPVTGITSVGPFGALWYNN